MVPVSDSPEGSGFPLAQEGDWLLLNINVVCVTASLPMHTSRLTHPQEPLQGSSSLLLTGSCSAYLNFFCL